MTDYHARSLALVDEIERTYPVTQWQVGDVPVWPLARLFLHGSLYKQSIARGEQKAHRARRVALAASYALSPLIDAWQSRSDLRHTVLVPQRADAMYLGNGDAYDLVDGAWRDRFGDPLISELQKTGRSTFLMQYGDLCHHLPWQRPTFSANTIRKWGVLSAAGRGLAKRLPSHLPDYDLVQRFLRRADVPLSGLASTELRKAAATVAATAHGFEQVLKTVRPSLCFILGFFSTIGFALSLACRRQGILSIEVQHGGCGARNEGYCWSALPDNGYAVLPSVFWTWTEADAAVIEAWSSKLKSPWHRSIQGGHPQLPAWFDDNDPQTRSFDARINEIRARSPAGREILVALQANEGYQDLWNEFAALIERAPSNWRWWLRHRKNTRGAERQLGRLFALRRPNVLIEEASLLPLPALLRHMDAFVSIRSGAAIEASMFGLRPIFLSSAATEMFPELFDARKADIIDDMNALEAYLYAQPIRMKTRLAQPPLSDSLSRLESMVAEYSVLCAAQNYPSGIPTPSPSLN